MAPRLSVCFFFVAILFIAAIVEQVSSKTLLPENLLGMQKSGSRNLLQAAKSCPINFEFMNYTIITSQCKGPQYPPSLCCKALKDFACPYSENLNDLKNDCATTMFSYITLYGKYPPGLFASECKEGKEGLACPTQAPQSNSASYLYPSISFVLAVLTVLGLALVFS